MSRTHCTLISLQQHYNTPASTWSGEMVFFCCLLQMSLASEETRWMNSVQQLSTSSLASLATRMLGMISLIILFSAARGILSSSSVSFSLSAITTKTRALLDSSLLVSLGLWFQYERILGLSTGALSLLCSTLKRQLLCTVQLRVQ